MAGASADEHIRRRYEPPELASAIERQVSSLVRQCAEGDEGALEAIGRLAASIERAQFDGARALYRSGRTWTEVGDALGVTRQAASARFRGED